MKNFLVSLIVAGILTSASYFVGLYYGWITEVNWLEAFSVFTSYSCTYLCVVQSRVNYIIGAISVIALVVLFYQSQLYSSMILNIYLVPTLIYGWFRWGRDDNTKPVAWVKISWWPVYLGLTTMVWYGLMQLTNHYAAAASGFDSFILAGSILAQFLLDQKKIENWAIWAIVNVVAIYTYWEMGLVVVAIQYIFFSGEYSLWTFRMEQVTKT